MSASSDYVAIILIGGGSSHGRSPDKEEAIKLAMRYYRDWDGLFDIYDQDVKLNVVDVRGYKELSWGGHSDGWLHGTNAITGMDEPIKRKVEIIIRHMPKKRKRD